MGGRSRIKLFFAAAIIFSGMLACDFISGAADSSGSSLSATQTSLALAVQVAQVQTEVAQAGGGQPTLAPTLSFEGFTPPEGITVQNGRWFLGDKEVILTSLVNENGSTEIWASFVDSPGWPIYILSPDGTWMLGFEEWTAMITIVNTTDVPLLVDVTSGGEGLAEVAEPQELTPYEYYSLTNTPPGIYQFSFSFDAGQPVELTCAIEVFPSSYFIFVVTPSGIAVAEESFEPQTPQDMDVRTSPLCGG